MRGDDHRIGVIDQLGGVSRPRRHHLLGQLPCPVGVDVNDHAGLGTGYPAVQDPRVVRSHDPGPDHSDP